MSKFDWLWGSPYCNGSMDKAELKEMLLETGGTILRRGKMVDIVVKHLGAGVYKVTAPDPKEKA